MAESLSTLALRDGVIVATKGTVITEDVARNLFVELANLGFHAPMSDLQKLTEKDAKNALANAREIIGDNRKMKPVYANFPVGVTEMDSITLLAEQILHYWTGGAFMPDHEASEFVPLEEFDLVVNPRKVTVQNVRDYALVRLGSLLNVGIAWSPAEIAFVEEALKVLTSKQDDIIALASAMTHYENMGTFLAQASNYFPARDLALGIIPNLRNADAILRTVLVLFTTPVSSKAQESYSLAVNSLSDSDAWAVRYLPIPRAVRREIVEAMGRVSANYHVDRLLSRQALWQRIVRSIHGFEVVKTDRARRALDIISDNVEYRTLNASIEEGMASGNANEVINLLAAYQPAGLLRRAVALLRIADNESANLLANAIAEKTVNSPVSTLVSAYNGVKTANSDFARVTAVAGRMNNIREAHAVKVNKAYITLVGNAILESLKSRLGALPAPTEPVGVIGNFPVPLNVRTSAFTDKALYAGSRTPIEKKASVLRVFSHWTNNQSGSGYMDIGVAILDSAYNLLDTCSWNTWNDSRDWAVYSGDQLVAVGDSAGEFIDIRVEKLKKQHPQARWAVMSIDSYSGFPIDDVDIVAGVMVRTEVAAKGDTFDARTVENAFHPTTRSTQSNPLAVDLTTMEMVWLDASNGSISIGSSIRDAGHLPAIMNNIVSTDLLSCGELLTLWADAHNMETTNTDVLVSQVMQLL